MEEGHFAVTKGEKTAMFYRLKYRYISFLLCRTVIVTLISFKFCILAKTRFIFEIYLIYVYMIA